MPPPIPQFMLELPWWLALGAAILGVSLPSILRSFRPRTLIPSILLTLASIGASAILAGPAATAAVIVISAVWGVIAALLAIFFAGLGDLTKKRY
ncbi:MAG: hypothetical protein A3K90_03575 [Pelodictyon luteolum]|uniref:Uncharacterized protein n=1 Tax=Pelodictyon luteolum TaxID=1100 RepID=A0A165LDB0_PELLU|nr:hypothetical protein [Pelodictyon luteolum]KZK73880.1 MAG: hypothetical protein A3K90_03575 [Pelodictyon luteolum]